MRKRKQLLALLILFTLSFSFPIILSISCGSSPTDGILLFQAITTNNFQNLIPDLNQSIAQLVIGSENIENSEIQQNEIGAKACSLSSAWVESAIDYDSDGYYRRIIIRWDADTTEDSEVVRVEIGYYINKNYTFLIHLHDGWWYTIYDSQPSIDEYEYINIDGGCNMTQVLTGVIDFRLKLYNQDNELQDTIVIGDIPMESRAEDFIFLNPLFIAVFNFIESANLVNASSKYIGNILLVELPIFALFYLTLWILEKRGY